MTTIKTAPDGGPLSEAHRFLNSSMTQTMPVRKKNSGKIVNIEPQYFNEALHERIEKPIGKTIIQKINESVPVEHAIEPEPKIEPFGMHTMEELLTYTRDELRKMPEYPFIEKKPIDKNGIVDEILKVREKRKSGEL